ncbi:MAG TPA: hypothetical protein VD838_04515 [Anaeromyxobacteraceae bacterium]|nr:hypothetical protein [Anaeromyxobacteraceae bacterium]
MAYSGHPVVRGHLRLATSPIAAPPRESRFLLLARAALAVLALAWYTAVAWIGVGLALVPLLWRRAPLGRRLRPHPPREARVIPFQPHRQAR